MIIIFFPSGEFNVICEGSEDEITRESLDVSMCECTGELFVTTDCEEAMFCVEKAGVMQVIESLSRDTAYGLHIIISGLHIESLALTYVIGFHRPLACNL